MSEEKTKMELPQGWKKTNFYSLNLAYCFFVLFVSMQVGAVKNVLIRAFKEDVYDIINGWVLIFLLVTASGAGILGFIRMISVKKIIDVLEKNDKPDP